MINADDIQRIMDKYDCDLHQIPDYRTKEINEKEGRPLCPRCEGTGNELYSMYRKCSACSGTGVRNHKYKYEEESLGHPEKRVLVILCRRWRWWGGGNSWRNFDELAEEIRRPLKETKKAVHSLAEKGYLKHTPMVNDDGIPSGSGYFLTTAVEGGRVPV